MTVCKFRRDVKRKADCEGNAGRRHWLHWVRDALPAAKRNMAVDVEAVARGRDMAARVIGDRMQPEGDKGKSRKALS